MGLNTQSRKGHPIQTTLVFHELSPFFPYRVTAQWLSSTSHFLLVLSIMLPRCGHITVGGASPVGQAQRWAPTPATSELPLHPQVAVPLLSFLLHKEVPRSSVTCVAFTGARVAPTLAQGPHFPQGRPAPLTPDG